MDEETQEIIEQSNRLYASIASEWCRFGGFLVESDTLTQTWLNQTKKNEVLDDPKQTLIGTK